MRFSVYNATLGGWLIDTCAGGSWGWDSIEAMWFDSEEEAKAALVAAEIWKADWPHSIIRVK